MSSRPYQIGDHHLRRKAIVYVRQSSPYQVRENIGSTAVQRDLVAKIAAWGWPPTHIEEVDDDLGVSGSWAGTRDGFKHLLDRMRQDEIGLVADIDSSRLSRNEVDFSVFAEVARRHRVLLAHLDQIIDFTDPDSAFIGGVLGMIASRENRVRIRLSVQSRRKKAELGIAPTAPPVGYVRRSGGAWGKDPDPRVQEVIALIFDKCLEIGSIRGVVRYLRSQQIQIPHRPWRDRPQWQDANYNSVHGFLKNPVYAGRYIFGQTVLEPPPEGSRKRRQRPQPPSNWIVHDQHHEPYVDPAKWTQIQEQIRANHRAVRQPAGRGEALVQGLLRCTVHQVAFQTVYTRRHRHPDGRIERRGVYVCRPGRNTAVPLEHQAVTAERFDAVIEQIVLEILAPHALDGLQEAVRQELRHHEALQRGRHDELRRAQQRVADAERAYRQADPNHPRLHQRLADQLEQGLQHLHDLEAHHRLHPLVAPVMPDDATLGQLRALLTDLPTLWRDARITSARRKTLVRMVISAIRVTPATDAWPFEIVWESGVRTRSALTKEDRAPQRVVRPRHLRPPWRAIEAGAYLFIRDRLSEGLSVSAITEALNAASIRHPRGAWREKSVIRAIKRLRDGRVPGLEPPPAPPSLTERVRALYRQGHSPAEIVDQLRRQGVQTRHQTLVTRGVVYKALERLGLPTHFTITNQAISSHLRAWGPTARAGEIAQRLNGLGFTTKWSRPWTPESVRGKLRNLGIPFARCRGASAPVADAAEELTPGADE